MSEQELAKIVAIMKANCLHAYLATVDDDQPRVRPVSPIIGDDMSIWVATYPETRKVGQIRQNPKVCLAFVDSPGGDRAAFVIGRAEIIPDLEAKRRVWKLASFDLGEYFKDGPESEDFCLLRIIPSLVEWRDSWAGLNTYKPDRPVQATGN